MHSSTKLFARIAFVFCALIISGCSAVNPSFMSMTQQYSVEAEKYSNNQILLNLLRASKGMPMSFMDTPNIIGSGSVQTSPAVFRNLANFGGVTTGINESLAFNLNKMFGFTQASLDNADFQKTFVTVLPLETVNFFQDRGVSNELLLSLVIDRADVRQPDGTEFTLINDPGHHTFAEFQNGLRLYVSAGFRTEINMSLVPVGPPLTRSELTGNSGIAGLVPLLPAGAVFQPAGEINGVPVFQSFINVPTARFCFEKITGKYQEIKEVFGKQMRCASIFGETEAQDGSQNEDNQAQPGKSTLAITLRSPRDVFVYLGKLIDLQRKDPTKIVKIVDPMDPEKLVPLLQVRMGTVSESEEVATAEYAGETYSISRRDPGFSSAAFNLATQFFRVSKTAAAIPKSPAILVR